MIKDYPRLSFIALSYILVAIFFSFFGPDFFHTLVAPFGIGGIFIVGMMYSYSLTTSLGALLLPAFLAQFSTPLIAIVGGLGGTFADVTIFRLIKGDLKKEIKRLGATKFMKKMLRIHIVRHPWFRDTAGILLIMSPLPDEIGIAIMATTHMKENTFRLISLIGNTVGIYCLVSLVAPIY
ncbi:MAG: hypothetical protein V4437_00050 [Patescibacteria group bacterium]